MGIKQWRGMMLLMSALLILPVNNILNAQLPGKVSRQYKEAVNLYNKGLFSAAEKEFTELLQRADPTDKASVSFIESYLTLITIEMSRPDIDYRVRKLKQDFPETVKMNEIDLQNNRITDTDLEKLDQVKSKFKYGKGT